MAADEAIAACRGDVRDALKAMIVANEFLESEVCELIQTVSNAYVRGRFKTAIRANRRDDRLMKKRNTVVLAKKSQTIDLEFCTLKIVVGKTYEDDRTTVFDVYIHEGLRDGSFEEVARCSDTILLHHPDA
jgi:hypothetical protein